jgi:hypothetical protein
MVKFNPNLLNDPLGELGMQYGAPKCLVDFTKEVLSLLPTSMLGGFSQGLIKGKAAAQAAMATAVKKLFRDTGIVEFDTTTGKLVFLSSSSKNGIESSELDFLGEIGEFLGALAGAGAALWENYQVAEEFIQQIEDCLGQVEQWLDKGNDTAGPKYPTSVSLLVASSEIQNALSYINAVNAQLTNIDEIIRARAEDPTREPVLGGITPPPVADDGGPDPIFRLVYGPPKSKSGQFLLSEDGLYYDSQGRRYKGGGLPSEADIGFIPAPSKWKLQHPANLGGKGTSFSIKELERYFDTLLDVTKVDDSEDLKIFYDKDTFLTTLYGQKNVAVHELKKQRTRLEASGYTDDSALIVNIKQQLFSTIDEYDRKIDKRKKQIELAVKSQDLFGTNESFRPGEIPVNDFSYLGNININISIQKQRILTFDHGEVEDIILPLRPTFVKATDANRRTIIDPIEVADMGTGSIVDINEVSSTTSPVLTVTDNITIDKLIASYSFLVPEVELPYSEDFNVLNDATEAGYNNAQLVGKSLNSVFVSGLAIPKLDGIVRYTYLNDGVGTFAPSGLGSYVRLPQTPEMQNLMYNTSGCTFDTWLYMDNFCASSNYFERTDLSSDMNLTASDAGWTDFNYYKILLANENIGGSFTGDAETQSNQFGTKTVKGMLMGFTRDPQITKNSVVARGTDLNPGSTLGIDASSTVSSVCFFIAPTQSINGNDVEFIRSGDCENEVNGYLGMTVDVTATTSSGYKLLDLSSAFQHLSVSMNVRDNLISVFLNGELLASEPYSEVFGIPEKEPARIPTFISPKDSENESFFYSSEKLTNQQTTDFNNGPSNDVFFTPWIVGGGWTDGIPVDTSSGGFMSTSHGFYSGLTGHIGSFKVYSKPLNISEAYKNYTAHKGFFEDIDI